ncbi:DUF72 domain-containing protein [Mucilaginibacter myungsuensis]|uniref:DUF72 domain-containing protein n=1 Tax=Mucilaginibacter myungsuensis TaxID=649104 RepID=A0A929KSL0_9SPHI|nr:DUF72 domain-containing protein [Mucilaginibacter myungsuensis]MBE9660759.1 DUF72 domain-containing protein [Mucilaginibacter myungsuensis]MDN3600804.1 DUF72 domain-containing protein [Mucilaginibacter myungsuensis]
MFKTTFFAGTSGLLTSLPKRDFPKEYQDRSRLGFYALQENSIEINSTFYKLPQAKTISRWVTEVPDDFRFTFKLWKEVTHQKHLGFRQEDIEAFFHSISGAADHRGCLLVQFPPSLKVDSLPQFKALLPLLTASKWKVAVEFRHASWYQDQIYEYLNAQNAALVIQDMPKSATPLELTTDDLVYLRFHGPGGSYKGSYSNEILTEYAEYINEWQEEGRTVYVYFNNTAGAALNNLQTLKSILRNH